MSGSVVWPGSSQPAIPICPSALAAPAKAAEAAAAPVSQPASQSSAFQSRPTVARQINRPPSQNQHARARASSRTQTISCHSNGVWRVGVAAPAAPLTVRRESRLACDEICGESCNQIRESSICPAPLALFGLFFVAAVVVLVADERANRRTCSSIFSRRAECKHTSGADLCSASGAPVRLIVAPGNTIMSARAHDCVRAARRRCLRRPEVLLTC